MSPYTAEQISPFARAAQNIGDRLAQMPYMRMMGQQRAAMGQYYQAHAGQEAAAAAEAGAHSRLYNAQAEDEEQGNAAQMRLSDALKKFAADPNDTDATGDMLSQMGNFFKKNPEQASRALGNLQAQIMAMRGSTNFPQMGALQGGAASIANNEANNARIASTPRVLPANSTLVDPRSGRTVSLGSAVMRPGEQLFTPNQTNLSYGFSPSASGPAVPVKSDPALVNAAEHLVMGGVNAPESLTGTNAPAGLSLIQSMAAKNSPVVPAANPPTSGTAMPGGAAAGRPAFVPAPPPAQRVAGQHYTTPKGIYLWDGQQWQVPAAPGMPNSPTTAQQP